MGDGGEGLVGVDEGGGVVGGEGLGGGGGGSVFFGAAVLPRVSNFGTFKILLFVMAV